MTNLLPPDTDMVSKRTRICGPQSKLGCFTCKRRRIKCDEEKPVCLRCLRSRVHCQGYPTTHSQPATPVISPVAVLLPLIRDIDDVEESDANLVDFEAPSYHLSNYSSRPPTQTRLAIIGVGLLVSNVCGQLKFSTSIFGKLLPLLSDALPSVNAAAAALGAIYEVQSIIDGNYDEEDATAAEKYGLAVRSMQHDIESQQFGRIPLLMTCMLLACSELLLRRPSYALMHAEAAFEILNTQTILSTAASDSASQTWLTPVESDEMFLLFRAIDIQISTYADRRTPSMPSKIPESLYGDMSGPIKIRDFEIYVIAAVHDCLHFTSGAASRKYISTETLQSDVHGEQNRHIANLTMLVQRLDCSLSPGEGDASQGSTLSESWPLLFMLRNLCLSMIILASTILTPYETAFDTYLWHFQQIVLAAEKIFDARDSYDETHPHPHHFPFTPLPSLIHPLYLTASKCRHPTIRRRAISLLRRAGSEGPWVGKLVAAVAERLAEIEEASSGFAVFLLTHGDGEAEIGPSNIPEGARISGVGMDVELDMDAMKGMAEQEYQPAVWTAKCSNITRVRFSRCKDVETMLSITRSVSSGPLSNRSTSSQVRGMMDGPVRKTAFAKNRGGFLGGGPKLWEMDEAECDGVVTWKDRRFWDVWDEVLEFGGER